MRPVAERVLARTERRDLGYETPCLVFVGALSVGYGSVGSGGRAGRTVGAHVAVWEAANGPVPDGFVLDHLCHPGDGSCPGNAACPHRACVELAHLALSTHGENIRRGVNRNRLRESCIHGHPLSGANLYVSPRGGRECRACRRDRQRK